MNHAVVMLMYNQTPAQLDLTKDAVESVFAQDIGTLDFYIINNGSTYETRDWLKTLEVPNGHNVYIENYRENRSPTIVSNEINASLFGRGYPVTFGVPNDAILPPNCFSEFHKWPRGIVTGSMTENIAFPLFDKSRAVNECTPMAVVMLRKWVHDALVAKDGYFFDPRFKFYCSDCDFALRIASCGIHGIQLDLQYYHFGSGSHRMLSPEKARIITSEADADRRRFIEKWKFSVDSLEYGAMAQDPNFRGEGKKVTEEANG